MKLILIRHGESTYNKFNRENPQKRIFTGQFDTPLTERGRQQAHQLQQFHSLKSVETVYASTLSRAFETAYLATSRNDILLDDRLKERSLGTLEGQSLADLTEFCATLPSDFTHSFQAKAPGGENYTDVLQRMQAFFNDYWHNDMAIFSHQGCIRTMMMHLMNLTEDETLRLHIPNCRPIVLEGETVGKFIHKNE